ncbi:MAG: O-linked N-acetylglucosamine transferase, SPINDLY family protein [Phenylobacterium sp.]
MTLAANRPAYDPQAELELAQAEIFGGQAAVAASRLEALLEAEPDYLIAGYWLAAAKGAAGDWAGFASQLREARNSHALGLITRAGGDTPRLLIDAEYAKEVAEALYAGNHVAVASAAYAIAAAQPGAPATVLLGHGLSLQHQGRVDEALAAFVKACEAYPQSSQLRGFLLYILFHVEDGVRRHAEEAGRWAQTFATRPLPRPTDFPNRPLEGRRLRIGYVAPATSNQLRQFLLPVLENHDRASIHVTLYVNHAPRDELPVDEVRVLGAMTDEDAARLVRKDRIDVLVDLWGHTAGTRLGVFALKPAPVQASWMNYVQTTGLAAIDYLLHPDCFNVPGAQDHCVEKLWHIGPVMSPFRPDERPPISPAPALANGYVTFASYSHPVRLNDQTVDAWARILVAVPTARLQLRYCYWADEVLQNVTLMRFAARGVSPDRIEFEGQVPQPEYYQSYSQIDLALDPAPCPGGTTSMDAVANGVPVLTKAGADYYSRNGVAVLEPLGLTELITESWDDYVARAVELAGDVHALDALRRRVRAAFDASPRGDDLGFTRMIEGEFRKMFELWRERRDGKA